MNIDQHLTTRQVAELLAYSPEQINLLCHRREFPNAFRLGARGRWRIPAGDIDVFRRNHRHNL